MLCIFVEAGVSSVDTGELWRLMLVSGQYLVMCNGPPSRFSPLGVSELMGDTGGICQLLDQYLTLAIT